MSITLTTAVSTPAALAAVSPLLGQNRPPVSGVEPGSQTAPRDAATGAVRPADGVAATVPGTSPDATVGAVRDPQKLRTAPGTTDGTSSYTPGPARDDDLPGYTRTEGRLFDHRA